MAYCQQGRNFAKTKHETDRSRTIERDSHAPTCLQRLLRYVKKRNRRETKSKQNQNQYQRARLSDLQQQQQQQQQSKLALLFSIVTEKMIDDLVVRGDQI